MVSAFIVIPAFAIVDKLTNNKIGNFFTLGFMYMTQREEVRFDEMILKVPYYYTKRINGNTLILVKFPKGSVIVFEKNRHIAVEEFLGKFNESLKKMNLTVIGERKIEIDEEAGYFISAWISPDPLDFLEYVTIPSKRITAYFNGNKKDVQVFRNIVKQIRFVKGEQ